MESIHKNIWYLTNIIFLFWIILNCNKVNSTKQKPKNKNYLKLKNYINHKNIINNHRRKLDEEEKSILACIKKLYGDDALEENLVFIDLKIYLDNIYLIEQLESKGLNKYL